MWREAWKYGERAFRYCQLDVGHAMAAIRYACAVNGWSAEIVSTTTDNGVANLLGLDRDQDFDNAEREHAELLLKISTTSSSTGFIDFDNLRSRSLTGQWYGRANILDKHHLYHWPIIEEVARATEVDTPLTCAAWVPEAIGAPAPCETTLMADEIIHRRRSAQMYDGQTGIEAPQLFRILDMLIPRPNIPPWDVMPWQPKIHLVLFVHRVNGLAPGLYIMPRNRQALQNLKSAMLDTLEWLPMESTPRHLDLYRLVKANAQKAAASLTCHQRIASDSAFSLGMLSEFDAALLNGPWAYKRLYWEAGLLGQVLYLEAEAINLQGTGIGCFFDDPFHEMLGLKDSRFQCLYHFTMGGALNDSRLRTLMPYEHLKRD
jgi:nitroreductase